jgi:hypothetical protein
MFYEHGELMLSFAGVGIIRWRRRTLALPISGFGRIQ